MKYSIIIPFHNEELSIPHLFKRLIPVCNNLRSYEILCINDASTDKTNECLLKEKYNNPKIKIIKFLKKSGQSDALIAGFQEAKGEVLITLDGDLQNPPEEIPKLLDKLNECDLVVGWRYNRHDSIGKKFFSYWANLLKKYILNDFTHDTGCSLKVFKRNVVENIVKFKGIHRFFPAIAMINGFSVSEVQVGHESRLWGKTKYSNRGRIVHVIFDLFLIAWMKRRKTNFIVTHKL